MKKNNFIFLIFLLFAIPLKLDSAQCSGGEDVYVCGHMDFLAHAKDAFKNCCAGSVIQTVDICGGDVRANISVTRDGVNSTCFWED